MPCRRTSRVALSPRRWGALLGIALMLLSVTGGARVTRISEEIQETQTECCEAVLRTEESRTPSLTVMRVVKRRLPCPAAIVNRDVCPGHEKTAGHSLSNGLRAPLRC